MIPGSEARYLLSLKQSGDNFGICFVDAATGKFHLGLLENDTQRLSLRTLLSEVRPVEVVYDRETASSDVLKLLKFGPVPPSLTGLRSRSDFWDALTTREELPAYFEKGVPALCQTLTEVDEVASALGGCVSYLRKVMLDRQVVCMATFEKYTVGSVINSFLVLDAASLANLEILENNKDGTLQGSLLSFMDRTVTPAGKRLFRRWLSRPLKSTAGINARLDAVDDLNRNPDIRDLLRTRLGKLPDIERLLNRIHLFSLQQDKGAVFFEDVNQGKLKLFAQVVEALQALEEIIQSLPLEGSELSSRRLRSLVTVGTEEGFPSLKELLEHFKQAFDWPKMKQDGSLLPSPGYNEEYDAAVAEVKSIQKRLQDYLVELRREYNDKSITFVNIKSKYEVEVPIELVNKSKPQDWEFSSARNGFQRFTTARTRRLVADLEEAEEGVKNCLTPFICGLFKEFHSHYSCWSRAVSCAAELDCLLSLAVVSSQADGVMSRPQFVEETEEGSMMRLVGMRHPLVSIPDFIPNDTFLGTPEDAAAGREAQPRLILLTGPNMGGKSTLLRQVCLAVVMAQVGCYVPSEEFVLTPVDRIFTRLGASDRIMEGKSTFFMELEETSTILHHATSSSLVILDELGRGTSTFDGTAIAYAVLQHLAHEIKCRCLFATHYHMLCEEFGADPTVANFHMACQVDEEAQRVTFLYKFKKGSCPKSYGMNVARLAGLPESVVKKASQMSQQFEDRLQNAHGRPGLKNNAEWMALVHDIVTFVESLKGTKMPEAEKRSAVESLWNRAKTLVR
eukprot:GILI01031999.1.p1 GENE.GILI01031999.1~~GILI01031999.1.p1  ORF type:complete len:855 (+),score=230.63 GILI01031999.1:192-2567(+)